MPPTPRTLDEKTLAELARPFTPAAVKVKALTKAGDDNKSSAAFYVDARLVAERLNAVVGPENWEDDYEFVTGPSGNVQMLVTTFFPVICRLTVCGLTKTDIGQAGEAKLKDNVWKSVVSDAFKRSAVKFRIGAYLYAIPRMRVPAKVTGEGQQKRTLGLAPAGEQQARAAYERWLSSPELNRFGDPLDHGDVGEDPDEEGSAERGQLQVA